MSIHRFTLRSSLRFLVETKMGMKRKRKLINAYEKQVEKKKCLGWAFIYRKNASQYLIFSLSDVDLRLKPREIL